MHDFKFSSMNNNYKKICFKITGLFEKLSNKGTKLPNSSIIFYKFSA